MGEGALEERLRGSLDPSPARVLSALDPTLHLD